MPRTFKLFSIIIVLVLSLLALAPLNAQSTNLLFNPGFEQGGEFSAYQSSLGDPEFNFAQGWAGWITFTPRNFDWQNIRTFAFPHNGNFKTEGNNSQNVGRAGGTYTVAAYQTVNNINNGTQLQATVKAYLENGGDNGARVRIGIGSNVGADPTSPNIVWSAFGNRVNEWQQLSVQTTVAAGNVTVFIFMTQDRPNGPTGPNNVFLDEAGLFVTGSGTPVATSGSGGTVNVPPPPTSTPAPAFANFVTRGGIIENGRLIHVVVQGDTLAAIAVAYGVPIARLQELNGIIGGNIFVGDRIIIGDAPTATPPNTPRPVATTSNTSSARATTAPGGIGFFRPTQNATGVATTSGFTRPTSEVSVANTTVPTITPQSNATIVAVVPTNTVAPTTAPTEAPTNTSEPTNTPEPTEVVESPTPSEPLATSTPAATAPVTQAPPLIDPLSTTASVCVLMFDDENQNRIQNSNELLLAGGVITLRQGSTDVVSYQTNGTSEPFCFEDIEPGTYTAVATAPEGYGLTTAPSLVVSAQAGTSFRIVFGAARGVAVAVVPTANVNDAQTPVTEVQAQTTPPLDITSIAGILVVALAGIVFVGGAIAFFIARRMN
jgi:hypothetical protein